MVSAAVFELALHSTTAADRFRAVAHWRRPGELAIRRETSFTLSAQEVLEQATPRGYGEVLGRKVFVDGVRDLLVQARADAERLRVLLAVEAPALHSLHWERLAAPRDDGRWRMLGQAQRTPLSLYVPSVSDRRFSPFEREALRALVVVASPAQAVGGAEPFDEAAALDATLEGLGDIPAVVLGKDPRAVGPPTLNALCTQLTAERFTVLHVVGHGLHSRRRTGEDAFALLLDDEDGAPVLVRGSTLLDRLLDLPGGARLPHLAVLAVCDSATPEAGDAFGGLGPQLVRQLGMPAVVAMTDRVSQKTAITLSRTLYRYVQEHGQVDRALVEAAVAVRDREDAAVPALYSRLGGRPLFREPAPPAQDRGAWVAAVERLDGLFEERAPVLLDEVRALVGTVKADPQALAGEAARAHQDALGRLEQLCEDVLELPLAALARGEEPPPYDVRCPFPGLTAFTEDQRRFFCGRDPLVETVAQALRERPFLAVLGSSGCGKSSLVKAGVIPRLRDQTPGLRVVTMRPGAQPVAALESALAELGDEADGLLYVDQFEEVFTLCRDASARMAFFDRVLAAAASRHAVLVSMRADFVGECAVHEGLRARIEGLRLVPRMTPDELRNAIEEQGQNAGLRYQSGLCELILRDIERQPGAMPLLQHLLRGLYERRHGRWLRVEAYLALGRVDEAIAQTAEAVWTALSEEERPRLRAVMLELTELSEDPNAETRRYLRRRASLAHLCATVMPDHAEAVERLVERLANERLVVKDYDPVLGDVVEVAHEALLRRWERLQDWLEQAHRALRLRHQLQEAAAEWRAHERARDFLEHVGTRGAMVRSARDEGVLRIGPDLLEYVAACEQEDRRRAQAQQQAVDALAEERSRTEDAVLMAYVRAVGSSDPTRAALGLREVGSADAPGWWQEALGVLHRPIALGVLRGNVASVGAVMFSPDGQYVAAGSDDGSVWLWSVDGAAEVMVHEGHEGSVNALGFGPDGRSLVTGSDDRTVRVWRQDRDEAVVLRGHMGPVGSVRFSADGRRVLTASADGTAWVRRADGQGRSVVLRGHEEPVVTARFSPDERHVVTASYDGTARVWPADGFGEPVVMRHTDKVWSAEFSPDGRHVVTASLDGTAGIWRADGTGEPLMLRGHEDKLWSARFSPDGRLVATASDDCTVRVWKADVTSEPVVLDEHWGGVNSARFSPDGRYVVTASDDGTARIWRFDGSEGSRVLEGHQGSLETARFSPDGRHVVTASNDGTARLWLSRGSEPVVLRGHDDVVRSVRYDPAGARVVTASQDGTVRVWAVDGSAEPVVLPDDQGPAWTGAFSPDGQWVVVASEDGVARIWRADGTGEPVELRHGAEVLSASFSPDGHRVLTTSLDDKARIWTWTNPDDPVVLRGHEDSVMWGSFAPDGERVVTASADGTVRVWSTDGEGEVVLRGHEGAVSMASFSPDGTRIATASADGTVRVWPADGAGEPVVLRHDETVWTARFSPDGAHVVTASSDGEAKVWRADGTGTPIALPDHECPVTGAMFSPDGRRIVTAAADGLVRVWSFPTDFEQIKRLFWSATHEVIPVEDRIEFLGQTPAQARASFEADQLRSSPGEE